MALQFNVNNTPATGAVAMFTLWTTLIGATWTKQKDSDGTTYSASGVQVTSGAAGANGLANTNAWGIFKMPGSNKSFSIQRGTTNLLWRIVYSPSVGFTSGTPGATQAASASDGIIMLGGGTEAAPTFAALYQTDGGYRLECAADNAAPFGFWSIAFPTGSSVVNNCTHTFALDAMRAGTTISTDTDPYVTFANTGASGVMGANFSVGLKGTSPINSTSLVAIVNVVQPANTSNGYVADPATGKHVLRLIEYFVTSSMYKGVSTYFLWDTFQGDITPAPLTVVTASDRMCLGYITVDWNGVGIII